MSDVQSITQLLNRWGSGDKAAELELTPIVYTELQRMANRLFRGERPGHTLQPTALVHEAFVKLVDVDVTWQDRAHFFSLAARMMRRLLVNHANARNAAKRGGDAIKVTFADAVVVDGDADADLLDLEEALQALSELDARKAELIELQYFGGLSFKEMAEVTGLSSSTLDRDLRLARAWLRDQIKKES
ncbi:MAG: ECF-type sigma factor [Pseudomonadota bacterium]